MEWDMSTNPFLKQNKKKQEDIKIVVSDNFVDDKGNPVPFVMRIISAEEADRLSETCMEPVIDPNTRRKVGSEINQKRLQQELLVNSIVYPDLNDQEMLDSWEAKTPAQLLDKMLNMDEKSILVREFDKHFTSSEQISNEAEIETKNE